MSTNELPTQDGTATELPETDRPETCECWDADADLACFECFNAGFETQNPTISEN